MDSELRFPVDLEFDVVPAGISGVDQAQLNHVFDSLDRKIEALAKKIEAHRVYVTPGQDKQTRDSHKCQLICKSLQGEDKLRCLKQCVRPVVQHEELQALRSEFPIDLQRLDQDLHLRQHFERHQRASDTIAATEAEASLIADMYAMPLSTAALPEEAWARALSVLQRDQFAPQLDSLVRNWQSRAESYSPEAKAELARKINRHDTDGLIMQTARKFELES